MSGARHWFHDVLVPPLNISSKPHVKEPKTECNIMVWVVLGHWRRSMSLLFGNTLRDRSSLDWSPEALKGLSRQ